MGWKKKVHLFCDYYVCARWRGRGGVGIGKDGMVKRHGCTLRAGVRTKRLHPVIHAQAGRHDA